MEDLEDQEHPEADQAVPEDEKTGALEPCDPWAAGRAAGIEFPPGVPPPPPGTLNGGYLAVDFPRGYAGERRIHLMIVEEW